MAASGARDSLRDLLLIVTDIAVQRPLIGHVIALVAAAWIAIAIYAARLPPPPGEVHSL